MVVLVAAVIVRFSKRITPVPVFRDTGTTANTEFGIVALPILERAIDPCHTIAHAAVPELDAF
jgi:hypothetical protein